jgi:hypothetical protein
MVHSQELPRDMTQRQDEGSNAVRVVELTQKGIFVKHIQAETGARVQIKGRGSGFMETDTGRESDEPMHINIAYVSFLPSSLSAHLSSECSAPLPRHQPALRMACCKI